MPITWIFQDPGGSDGDLMVHIDPCWAAMPAIMIRIYSWDRLMKLDDEALSKWLSLVVSPPGNPILWTRGIEACFWATSGSIAETEICMKMIRCLGGCISFWVSWHGVLVADPKTNRAIVKFSGVWSYWCFCGQDYGQSVIFLLVNLMGYSRSWTSLGFHHILPVIVPTKTSLSVGGCQIIIFGRGMCARDILIGHFADIAPHILISTFWPPEELKNVCMLFKVTPFGTLL